MSELSDLRAEVSRRRAAATAKVRRLKARGIDVEGSNYDPRRSPDVTKRYTRTQLNKYLTELNAFTSRQTQYTRLANGIVPADEWRKYRTYENRYNQIGMRDYSKVANIKLPGTGMTVEERDITMRPSNPKIRRGAGETVRRIYEPISLKPNQVDSPEALRKLIAHRKKQISKSYEPAEIARQRKEMRSMVNKIGDANIRKATDSLTDEQFKVLWNYGTFATDLSRDYERIQMLATGGAAAQQDRVHEDARDDIIEAVEWAQKNVPTKKPQTKKRRR